MIDKIISGGQTGADRAALDFAIAHGIPHGGWCSRGRIAEDGVIADQYQLAETPSADSSQRTEWNVRGSDGTVIFSIAPILVGGSKQTAEFAARHEKPLLHLSRERDGETSAKKLGEFLVEHSIKSLNVAGPRHSEEPEVGGFTLTVLEQAGLMVAKLSDDAGVQN
jgi:hypothetical protein